MSGSVCAADKCSENLQIYLLRYQGVLILIKAKIPQQCQNVPSVEAACVQVHAFMRFPKVLERLVQSPSPRISISEYNRTVLSSSVLLGSFRLIHPSVLIFNVTFLAVRPCWSPCATSWENAKINVLTQRERLLAANRSNYSDCKTGEINILFDKI